MKRKTRNSLLAILSLSLLGTVATFGMVSQTAKAEAVKPTGTKTETLTTELADNALSSFSIYGASVRTIEPSGIRFLTVIEGSDLAKIPMGASFGTLILPKSELADGELLTMETENVLVGEAMATSVNEKIPTGGMGYIVTLAGTDMEAIPETLYGEEFVARSYVKYEYTPEGETESVVDYVYSTTQEYRSLGYVASCELAVNVDTNAESLLNKIIAKTTTNFAVTTERTEYSAGDEVTVSVSGAEDGTHQFVYTLSSSNEDVLKVENGKVTAVGAGEATISVTIGAKTVTTAEITVVGKYVTAYSLAGYKGAETLSVTFGADSVNVDDIAMLELRNASNETVHSVYALVSSNVATFNVSGIENVENYSAVITTQKTATPTITDVKMEYVTEYDLAKIAYNAYLRKTNSSDYDKTLPGTWGDISTATDGWANYYEDGIRFLLQPKWQEVDEEGKIYNTADKETAKVNDYTKSDLFRLEFDETARKELKTVEINVNTYNYPGVFGPTLQIQNNSYHAYVEGTPNGTVRISTDDEHWANYLTFIGWFITTDVKDGHSQGYIQLNTARMVYETTLTATEMSNSNDNPSKVSDGAQVTAYDLAQYENIKALNVTFESTTEAEATVELRNASGQVIKSVSAAIVENKASFDLSGVSELSDYTAVILSKATVSSVTADFDVVYDIATIYYQLHQYLSGAAAQPGEGDCSIEGHWGNYIVNGVQFQMENAHKITVTSDGKFHNATGRTTEGEISDTANMIFLAEAQDGLKKIAIDVAFGHASGTEFPNLKYREKEGSTWTEFTGDIRSDALLEIDLTNEAVKAEWVNKICNYSWYAADSEGYVQYKTMTLTYEKALTATTIYG